LALSCCVSKFDVLGREGRLTGVNFLHFPFLAEEQRKQGSRGERGRGFDKFSLNYKL
jgi:hypothetical protein